MDASPHAWFGAETSNLHLAIDDALGNILGAYFDNPNHSYLSQLDVTYKTPDLMSHFLPPHEVSFTFCCSSIVFPR
ncbi:putative glutamine transport system permease protein [Streptococcus pneumoniae]|nr:putative glutamine transport system permease protein [Streptococcus pneumoniae]